MENERSLTSEDFLKLVQIRNAQHGFPNHLGIQILEIAHGYARAEMNLDRPEFMNATGNTVHGGVIFSLADSVTGAAAWSSGHYAATASSEIHYINAAMDSKKLIGVAKAVKFGKRLFVFDVEIYNEATVLIAKGLFSYMPLVRRILDEAT